MILFLCPFYFGPQMWSHTCTLLHRDTTEKRKRHSCAPVLHIITTGQSQHTANFQMYHLPLSCEGQHNGFKVDSDWLLSIVSFRRKSSNTTQKHKIIFKEREKEQKRNYPNQKNHSPDVKTGKNQPTNSQIVYGNEAKLQNSDRLRKQTQSQRWTCGRPESKYYVYISNPTVCC